MERGAALRELPGPSVISLELWSPGSPAFPAPQELAGEHEVEAGGAAERDAVAGTGGGTT